MTTKKVFAIGLLLIAYTGALSAQDIGQDAVLELSQEKESTSFFQIQAVAGEDKFYIWDNHAQDTSSEWAIAINERIFHLKANKWELMTKMSASRYFLSYPDSDFGIEQVLEFTEDRRKGSLKLVFINQSGAEIKIQPTLILDTYLGENTDKPFLISDGSAVSTITEFDEGLIPEWITTAQANDGIGVTFSFDADSMPEKVIMANYYELVANPLDFVVKENRSFITIHRQKEFDSALLIRFKQVHLSTNERVEFVLKFSLGVGAIFDTSLIAESQSILLQDGKGVSKQQSILDRLLSIDAIIESIDDKLEPDMAMINEEEITSIETMTEEEENLRREYGNSE